jgi:hypothetical protein
MIYDDQTSSAMNYYEELGVSPEATEQEIRKAHRRLVKLMHPDAQPDRNMKMLAETQMRRLNSIVSTLLDTEQRRAYDEQLLVAESPRSNQRASWGGIPWWLASALGAVVLTLVAIWVWADHLGSAYSNKSSRAVYVQPADTTLSGGAAPPAQVTSSETPAAPNTDRAAPDRLAAAPLDSKSVVVVTSQPKEVEKKAQTPAAPQPDVKQVKKEQPKIAPVAPPKPPETKTISTRTTVAPPIKLVKNQVTKPADQPPAPKKIFSLPPGSVIATAKANPPSGTQVSTPPGVLTQSSREYSAVVIPPAPLPSAMPPKPTAAANTASAGNVGASNGAGGVGMNPHDSLEGEWVYAPKEPEKRRAGFYPPEFINLKLFGAGDPGNLKGQYSAKYVVTDKPVSPDVNFELASVSKGSRKFVWQSNNGAKGTLSIDPIDDRTIRIDWHTTTAVHGPALTSGTATLVRRQ